MGIPTQSKSEHTTPINNNKSNGYRHSTKEHLNKISIAIGSIDNNNINKKRHSRKYIENNASSREAGHTPPPQINNVSRFSDLVHDTDKKQGPINWWNLKVKMPDDNTMNILSPHRIPVPATPTTPEYIMKTPDGLRISLLDVNIDDEKELNKLGIEVDDEKKEYIHNLKREQDKLSEKQKCDEKEREKVKKEILENGNSTTSESDTADYNIKFQIGPNEFHNNQSQPVYYEHTTNNHRQSRKRSKTPHDPSTPTILTYDWDTIDNNDPYSALEQWNANTKQTQSALVTPSGHPVNVA
eukprot:271141_1